MRTGSTRKKPPHHRAKAPLTIKKLPIHCSLFSGSGLLGSGCRSVCPGGFFVFTVMFFRFCGRRRTSSSGFRFLGVFHFALIRCVTRRGRRSCGRLLGGLCGYRRRGSWRGLNRFLSGCGMGNRRFGGRRGCFGGGGVALSKQASYSYGKNCGQQVLFHCVL